MKLNTIHLRAIAAGWELYDANKPKKSLGVFSTWIEAEAAWDSVIIENRSK